MTDVIMENEYAFSINDRHPVSRGHSLIIPKKHVTSVFELPVDDYHACFDLGCGAWTGTGPPLAVPETAHFRWAARNRSQSPVDSRHRQAALGVKTAQGVRTGCSQHLTILATPIATGSSTSHRPMRWMSSIDLVFDPKGPLQLWPVGVQDAPILI